MAVSRSQIIRSSRERYVVPAVATAISGTVLALLVRSQGATIVTIAVGVLTLWFAVALLDTLVSKIDLRPDALVLIELHRRRSIPRQHIESARTEFEHVVLKLRDGSTFKLPDTGQSSRRVLQTIETWLASTALAGAQGPS